MRQNKAIIIGITGGVGAGKSTVLDILQDNYNIYLIKADDIGNEVKLKGHTCYEDLVKLLGEDVLDEFGQIDKNKMAKMIFEDKELLFKVNSIIHPAVREEIEQEININSDKFDYIAVEAALLCEADYFPILNALFEVRTSEKVRIERLMQTRNYSEDKCKSIISNQSDSCFYAEASNNYANNTNRNDYYGYFLIENDSDTEILKQRINIVMEELNEHIR